MLRMHFSSITCKLSVVDVYLAGHNVSPQSQNYGTQFGTDEDAGSCSEESLPDVFDTQWWSQKNSAHMVDTDRYMSLSFFYLLVG